MRSIGFCLGASTITAVVLDGKGEIILVERSPHEGNPKAIFQKLFNSLYHIGDKVAVTGRSLKNQVNIPSLSEPEAVEEAYALLQKAMPKVQAIVSAGGETFLVYSLDEEGRIQDIVTGNKCAAGTGEFFLQQLQRMDLSLEEAIFEADLREPYPVAGRCSVFCKSDCTHALNKGESKGRVVAGLTQMMAGKIMELLKPLDVNSILLIGGVSQNRPLVDCLRQRGLEVLLPQEATYFEALGAALWAREKEPPVLPKSLYRHANSSFSFLSPLAERRSLVTFKEMTWGKAKKGDRTYLGLDVGSTTTKAILLREGDQSILAGVYLRTEGDPVGASRRCYESLLQQLPVEVEIVGVGVTGSGRQIAGLHALTEGVINEIIAHATAAVHFDPAVDTIFEIGGQDAKYTFLNNKVPVDYAMNEACSAGTGSFLEEAARETLEVPLEEIGPKAMMAGSPPNFSDQCAAFISSDIKNALHEGLLPEDILAGLVYSICQNYNNRVKGARPIGKKILMQGGVCYNQAIPMAMAALTGKKIIVPPEPGLMGAFGVALEVQDRIKQGLMAPRRFSLKDLARRELAYGKEFTCRGGKEGCDLRCTIKRVMINGRSYPFGGACNRYVNLRREKHQKTSSLDLVSWREKLLLEEFAQGEYLKGEGPLIGISKSLLTNIFYPLYFHFFKALDCRVILGDKIEPNGLERKGAAFCYPVELAHGFLQTLVEREPDYIFLPQIKGVAVENGGPHSVTCPFIQGEPYYLKAAFPEAEKKLLSPILDFTLGWEGVRKDFEALGARLGFSSTRGEKAFDIAIAKQQAFQNMLEERGRLCLEYLAANPDAKAIVLVGRPYNALAREGNINVPQKLASRGYLTIPFDMLPLEKENCPTSMYWSMGQLILKAAQQIKHHPQLFGIYLTNFSCGPDAFIVNYFRNILGQKPSLTLELDAHSADAGVDTRIEAFLDVIESYNGAQLGEVTDKPVSMARARWESEQFVIETLKGVKYPLTHPQVRVVLPSMGDFGTRALAAAFCHHGVQALALEPPGKKELQLGKNFTSCKECLPLILTAGSLLRYLQEAQAPGEITVGFMPKTSGPCRFGQYHIALKQILAREGWDDVALMSLSSENGYGGLSTSFTIRAWRAVIITDVLEEVRGAILALAEDQKMAMETYRAVEERLLLALECKSWSELRQELWEAANLLSHIPLQKTWEEAPKICLTGEIYVRRDGFSRQYLVERLAKEGIITRTVPVAEWLYYTDFLVERNLLQHNPLKIRVKSRVLRFVKRQMEKEIKYIFTTSGLYETRLIDVPKIIGRAQGLINPKLTGETILTVGGTLEELLTNTDGVIAIGPFGCMPNRMSEALLSKGGAREINRITGGLNKNNLPFLALETDGNPFPQLLEARIEALILQVWRRRKSKKPDLLGSAAGKVILTNEYFYY